MHGNAVTGHYDPSLPRPTPPWRLPSGPDGWRLPDGLYSAIINVSLWPHIGSTSKLLLTANTASCVGLAVLTAFLCRGQMDMNKSIIHLSPSLYCVLICSSHCNLGVTASDDCSIIVLQWWISDLDPCVGQVYFYLFILFNFGHWISLNSWTLT